MADYEIRKKIEKIDFKALYCCDDCNTERYVNRFYRLLDGFSETFGNSDDLRLFSASGRTEIGGNHTDHQHGAVLAGSLNLDVIGAVRENGENVIRVKSEGFPMDTVSLDNLTASDGEYGKSSGLIRGIAACFAEKGYKISGFDAYTTSNVLKGSGMSSSAAFEVLIAAIMNGLFAKNEVSVTDMAKFGQYAENVYFGKPCGLLDQMACASGGIVSIDFADNENPIAEKLDFDFAKTGYALCIIDTGADHANLTNEYAAITVEMREIADYFGKKYLNDVSETEFMKEIKNLRKNLGNDRAILRAMHYFAETKRAKEEAKALKKGDFNEFLNIVSASGRSSYMYLQNVFAPCDTKNQAVSLALALCDKLLSGRGAFRVHGGGFAGTVQAFVPIDMLKDFKNGLEAVFGEGMCHILSIRNMGAIEIEL
ncbi:MAG: galactokinase [Clostridia bacterium]|nr:galactokinase [Clostridia bacterium]